MRRIESGHANGNGSFREARLLREDGSEYSLKSKFQFREVAVNPTAGSFTLRFVFPNPQGVLSPGKLVRVSIKEASNEPVILIPKSAVSRDAEGNQYTLTVDTKGKVQLRMLTIDRAIGDTWFVSAGLSSGDRVIIKDIRKIRPGAFVKVVPFLQAQRSDLAQEFSPIRGKN